MSDNVNSNYKITMILTFVEILFDENVSDKVKNLRIDALKRLNGYLEYYEERGYLSILIDKIAEKKTKMIMQIKSKSEMEKMLKPSCPLFDGSKFITDKYSVIEEELISWSEASLRAPLNENGYKRYTELFETILPEYKNKLDNLEQKNLDDKYDEYDDI